MATQVRRAEGGEVGVGRGETAGLRDVQRGMGCMACGWEAGAGTVGLVGRAGGEAVKRKAEAGGGWGCCRGGETPLVQPRINCECDKY